MLLTDSEIQALEVFARPRNIDDVKAWHSFHRVRFQNFVDAGLLGTPPAVLVAKSHFKLPELRALAQVVGVRSKGNKGELIEQLLARQVPQFDEYAHEHKLLSLTEAGREAIAANRTRLNGLSQVMQSEVREFLRKRDVARACRRYMEHCRQADNGARPIYEGLLPLLEAILLATPSSLAHLSLEELDAVRVEVAATHIIDRPYAGHWAETASRDAKHVLFNANVAEQVQEAFDEDHPASFRCQFSALDIQSCAECRALAGQVFTAKTLPQFPLANCTSDDGCGFELETDTGWRRSAIFLSELRPGSGPEEEQGADSDTDESVGSDDGPQRRLLTLKTLFDAELITEEEYKSKRSAILEDL